LQSLSIDKLDENCEGQPLSIFVNAPYDGVFDWVLPNGNTFDEPLYIQSVADNLDEGIYNIQFTDRIGCQIDTFIVVEILPKRRWNQ